MVSVEPNLERVHGLFNTVSSTSQWFVCSMATLEILLALLALESIHSIHQAKEREEQTSPILEKGNVREK